MAIDNETKYYDGKPLPDCPVDNKVKQIGVDLIDENLQDIKATSLDAEQISIDQFSQGYTHTIFRDKNYIYAINRKGELVAGGPDAINVSDATDFAEILKTTVSNYDDDYFNIKVGSRASDGSVFYCKSSVTINKVGHLWGPGKNRGIIYADSSLAGDTVITFSPDTAPCILRFDSLKFHGTKGSEPDTFIKTDGAQETVITDTEFRDCVSWGIKLIDVVSGWNYVSNSWFLTGAGFSMSGAGEVILDANFYNAGCELNNCGPVSMLGGQNCWNVVFNNCTFEEQYIKGGIKTKEILSERPYQKSDIYKPELTFTDTTYTVIQNNINNPLIVLSPIPSGFKYQVALWVNIYNEAAGETTYVHPEFDLVSGAIGTNVNTGTSRVERNDLEISDTTTGEINFQSCSFVDLNVPDKSKSTLIQLRDWIGKVSGSTGHLVQYACIFRIVEA